MDKKKKSHDLYIINSNRLENNYLINVSINIISSGNYVKQKLGSKKANIQFNKWIYRKT